MPSLKSLFDRVEVINLASRPDRRNEVTRELARVDLHFGDGTTHLLEASSFTEPAGFATAGTRGCFDSHLRALKRAQAAGAERLIIIEDDCDLAHNAVSRIPDVVSALRGCDWDIFYGGYLEWPGESRVEDHRPLAEAQAVEGVGGSHFIAFSARAMALAIPYLEAMRSRPAGSPLGGPMHVDGAYSWFRKDHPELKTFMTVPPLVFQRPSRTDVHALRLFDRLPVLREMVALGRRLKRGWAHWTPGTSD